MGLDRMRDLREWDGGDTEQAERERERERERLKFEVLLSSAYKPTRQGGTKHDQLSTTHSDMYKSCSSFKRDK